MLSKHLFVTEKLGLIGSTSFGFAHRTIHDSKHRIELIVTLSLTNPTNM